MARLGKLRSPNSLSFLTAFSLFRQWPIIALCRHYVRWFKACPTRQALRVHFLHQMDHSLALRPLTKFTQKSGMANLQLPTACLLLLLLLRCLARWLLFGQCGITTFVPLPFLDYDCHHKFAIKI